MILIIALGGKTDYMVRPDPRGGVAGQEVETSHVEKNSCRETDMLVYAVVCFRAEKRYSAA